MKRFMSLVAIAVAALSVLAPADVPASAAKEALVPSLLTCAGKTTIKPSSYVLACADANTYFDSIHWAELDSPLCDGHGNLRAKQLRTDVCGGEVPQVPRQAYAVPTEIDDAGRAVQHDQLQLHDLGSDHAPTDHSVECGRGQVEAEMLGGPRGGGGVRHPTSTVRGRGD